VTCSCSGSVGLDKNHTVTQVKQKGLSLPHSLPHPHKQEDSAETGLIIAEVVMTMGSDKD
jgi:hypothetical protein